MIQKAKLAGFVFACAIIGGVIASQYIGWAYGFNPRLGWALGAILGHTIYWPFAFVPWTFELAGSGPGVISHAELFFFLCLMPPVALLMWHGFRRPKIQEFAPEAWGKKVDAIRAGLLDKRHPGVIVGRLQGKVLSYSGPEHQLVSGASRSGKGAGHVVPTLLNWGESVFVYDPKAECYDITASFRTRFSHAFYMNMTRADSACYNPLDAIRKGTTEVADIQNIVAILYDPAGTKQEPTFFDVQAMQLLTGLILHVMYAQPPAMKNLAGVRRLLSSPDDTFTQMSEYAHRWKADSSQPDGIAKDENGQPIAEQIPEVKFVGDLVLAMPPRLRGDVVATASSYLSVWADPLVAEKTSRSDFTAGDLVCSENPVSLYFQVPPSDDERLRPLTRLILSQIARLLMIDQYFDAEGRKKAHKLLYLIDEFPSLGKLGFFSRNLRVMAGYGIKAFITVQSYKDIIEAYGTNNTIIDNCHINVAFAAADSETQQKISTMLGEPVEYRASYTTSHDGRTLFGRTGRNEGETQRRLMTPGEVRELPYDTELVLVTGSKPFRAKKVRYWQEKPWSGRAVDIRNGQRGPDQAAGIDLPRPGGVKSVWQTMTPLNIIVSKADPPNTKDEPVEDAAEKITAAGLAFPIDTDDAASEMPIDPGDPGLES